MIIKILNIMESYSVLPTGYSETFLIASLIFFLLHCVFPLAAMLSWLLTEYWLKMKTLSIFSKRLRDRNSSRSVSGNPLNRQRLVPQKPVSACSQQITLNWASMDWQAAVPLENCQLKTALPHCQVWNKWKLTYLTVVFGLLCIFFI